MNEYTADIIRSRLKLYFISFLIFVLIILFSSILSIIHNIKKETTSLQKQPKQTQQKKSEKKKSAKKVGVINLGSGINDSQADISISYPYFGMDFIKFLYKKGFVIVVKKDGKLFKYDISRNQLKILEDEIKDKEPFSGFPFLTKPDLSGYKQYLLVPKSIINQIKSKAKFFLLGKTNVKILRIKAKLERVGNELKVIVTRIIYKDTGGIKQWNRS